MSTFPVVTAPGKLFLAGEYAVLGGGMAIVAAISRRAEGRFVPDGEPASPLVGEAVRATLEALAAARMGAGDGEAPPRGSVAIDTTLFSSGGRKLGLGSSAAAATVAVGAVLEAAGVPVVQNLELVFSLAAAAHRAAQGGVGSGADVAAAVHGGLVQFAHPREGAPVTRGLPPLPGVQLVVFGTGEPSSTVDRVRAVAAFAARDPIRHAACIGALAEASARASAALLSSDAEELIGALQAAGDGMDALGRAADVPIVTPPFAAAAAYAAELGGAAKPSGAGGGDVGVALFTGRAAADSFRARAAGFGLTLLDISIDSTGVARRETGAI
jgi:phosphomevalonate kinase